MAFQAPPIRALLIDISGTLLVGSSPTAGAVQALARLRAAHIPFRICSNNSKESTDATHKRLLAAGLDVYREELWTSIGVLKTVLKKLGIRKPYMLLSPSAREDYMDKDIGDRQAGAASVPDPTSSSPYDAVVVGLAPDLLDYAHLNTAFRILVGEDHPRSAPDPPHGADRQAHLRPPLVALHKGLYFKDADHGLSLGPGPFVRGLEDAARTSATVVGKPTRAFFEAVLGDLERDLEPAQQGHVPAGGRLDSGGVSLHCSGPLHDREDGLGRSLRPPPGLDGSHWEGIAVIGDDVQADLSDGAVELGLWRVLVKTGKYRSGDESRTDVLKPPDQVSASFAEFVETLLERRQTNIVQDVTQ